MDAIIAQLRQAFVRLPDRRAKRAIRYAMGDTLMSAFAMLFFQCRSLLNFQRRMQEVQARCNLQTVFQVCAVPSDTQMRTILDGAPTEPLRALLPYYFEKIRRAGWAAQFKTPVPLPATAPGRHPATQNYYVVALDGTQYFHSTAIQCPGCLRRLVKSEVHHSHVVVAATLIQAGTHRILPLDAEEVRNSDGTDPDRVGMRSMPASG